MTVDVVVPLFVVLLLPDTLPEELAEEDVEADIERLPDELELEETLVDSDPLPEDVNDSLCDIVLVRVTGIPEGLELLEGFEVSVRVMTPLLE